MMTPNTTRLLVAVALTGSVLAASGLSACGKMGSLDTAPPMFNDKAKAKWDQTHTGDALSSSSSGMAVSSASLSGGGNQTTLEPTAGTKKETEKALPDANGKNNMPNPYTQIGPNSQKIEGTGNAEGHATGY
jgi:hypothetical protein